MSTPVRLDDHLVHEAETEGAAHKRSPPKQIEYWAEIGKVVAQTTSTSDLLALMQGFAEVSVTTLPSATAAPATVSAALARERARAPLG
mgnify:FL=1